MNQQAMVKQHSGAMQMRSVALAAAWLAFSSYAHAAEPDLQATVATYLNAYTQGDKTNVLAALDSAVRVYGSDIAEVYSGIDGVSKMFDGDMKLWGGTGKFGAMRDVSTVHEGNLEAIFFNIPFSVRNNPPVLVRVSMVWRLNPQGWKLVESSNSVPTVGQSADEILKSAARQ